MSGRPAARQPGRRSGGPPGRSRWRGPPSGGRDFSGPSGRRLRNPGRGRALPGASGRRRWARGRGCPRRRIRRWLRPGVGGRRPGCPARRRGRTASGPGPRLRGVLAGPLRTGRTPGQGAAQRLARGLRGTRPRVPRWWGVVREGVIRRGAGGRHRPGLRLLRALHGLRALRDLRILRDHRRPVPGPVVRGAVAVPGRHRAPQGVPGGVPGSAHRTGRVVRRGRAPVRGSVRCPGTLFPGGAQGPACHVGGALVHQASLRSETRSDSSRSVSSVSADSPPPRIASARARFAASISAMRSSTVPSVIRRCTCTGWVWPMR